MKFIAMILFLDKTLENNLQFVSENDNRVLYS